MELELNRRRRRAGASARVAWGAVALTVVAGMALGGMVGAEGSHLLNMRRAAAPLPGVTQVQAEPITTMAPVTPVSPTALPDHVLLQVPFTTQAPLNNWAAHQESCEAANLTMLVAYWQNNPSVVIDPHAADASIHQIDGWKPQPDLNDTMMGQLAREQWGYAYSLLPNDPTTIAEQLSAGRPLLAEVRTHGLGNSHYPGYFSHYEQTGWSVPHFVLIIGYDSTGVWLNDPGISWGRGYHISYEQLTHAIADLDQHHPALSQGNVLLLIAPQAVKPKLGAF